MTHLLLHKTPNLVSSEPGAAHVAAFECKLTLRPNDVKRAFKTASLIKRKAIKQIGNVYDELNCPPIFGLLAHSQSFGGANGSQDLYKIVQACETSTTDHPRELLDVICVADTATIPVSKHVLVGKGLSREEREELKEAGVNSAIAIMYTIASEDMKIELDFSGAILAGLIYDLTNRLAFEDASIRAWADHLSNLGFYGGIGIPFYCDQAALSEKVRKHLKAAGGSTERWSRWNRNLP